MAAGRRSRWLDIRDRPEDIGTLVYADELGRIRVYLKRVSFRRPLPFGLEDHLYQVGSVSVTQRPPARPSSSSSSFRAGADEVGV